MAPGLDLLVLDRVTAVRRRLEAPALAIGEFVRQMAIVGNAGIFLPAMKTAIRRRPFYRVSAGVTARDSASQR